MARVIVVVPVAIIALFGLLLLCSLAEPPLESGVWQGDAPGISVSEINIPIPASKEVIAAPLTEHARSGHAQEAWNAETIQQHMLDGNCDPIMYSCPQQDYNVVYCEENEDMSIGLIIGRTIEQVVTGFMSKTSYWENRCK